MRIVIDDDDGKILSIMQTECVDPRTYPQSTCDLNRGLDKETNEIGHFEN